MRVAARRESKDCDISPSPKRAPIVLKYASCTPRGNPMVRPSYSCNQAHTRSAHPVGRTKLSNLPTWARDSSVVAVPILAECCRYR
jgi:hypothetical protein